VVSLLGSVIARIHRITGGPDRTRVVMLFACVLALESADLATVGAVAPQLQASLGISETQLGLLAAVPTLIGALATVPFGALADRVTRTRLLAGAILIWAATMALSAAAPDYQWLLLTRVGLGGVTAAAAPVIASLTGDLFPVAERGQVFGFVLSGELLGAGMGYVVCGSLASALSWRWGFGVLAPPAVLLAFAISRFLEEPARGGRDRLGSTVGGSHSAASGEARDAVAARGVPPVGSHVLAAGARDMTLARAVRYVLSIVTNRWLIAASTIGYFFLAGLRTFALVFVRGHFALSQGTATAVLFVAGLGAVAGVLVSGRLADRMLGRGRLDARIVVGAIAYFVATACLVPVLATTSLALALPFLVLAGAGLSSPNPPLDAARLDIVPSWLWGRAESVRTLLRQTGQAAAPLLFGVVADALGGARVSSNAQGPVSSQAARALAQTFGLMLVPLLLSGLVLLIARRRYPRDVATAAASEQSQASEGGEQPQASEGGERPRAPARVMERRGYHALPRPDR
jgi:MFS family permease